MFSGVDTLVKGTFGYFDPDYYGTGRLTRKSDVYAFGVVLLEVLCRKRAVDKSLDEEQWNLARWAQESIKAGNLKNIIDYDIRGEISPKCLKGFVRIAETFLLSTPKQRPSMAEVVVSLESLRTLQIKVNSLLNPAVRTIFGRMVNRLCISNGETSAQGTKHNSTSSGELPVDYRINKLKEFEFADLERATSNFSDDLMLGWGRFGTVFLGWVENDTFAPSKCGVGLAVAVNRLARNSMKGQKQWETVLDMLGRLAHPNIVSLLGSCCHEHNHLLVYEYMLKESFASLIWRNIHDPIPTPLSWGTRLTILIGAARGLSYLHSSKVIHRNVNSCYIFVDQDFNSKLGNFGFVKSVPEIGRTGVITTGHLRGKSDIYCFGIVLLETLTGLKPIDAKKLIEQHCLVNSTILIRAGRGVLRKIMDPCLKQNYPEEGAFKCTELALRCLEDTPIDRPSSDEVLQSLEQIYTIDNKMKNR